MKLVIAKGVFKDIYYWGTGFASIEARAKWDAFWSRQRDDGGFFWRTYIHDGIPYVVETGGSVYMHPMDFDLVLRKLGSSYRGGREIFPEIDELVRMCTECAAECGGSFRMTEPKVVEVDV